MDSAYLPHVPESRGIHLCMSIVPILMTGIKI